MFSDFFNFVVYHQRIIVIVLTNSFLKK